jgi:hypothetical protein
MFGIVTIHELGVLFSNSIKGWQRGLNSADGYLWAFKQQMMGYIDLKI